MGSPYGVTLYFYADGTEDEVFHVLAGLEDIPREDDVIYLNDVGYKVETVKLYIYDKEFTNPETGVTAWSVSKVIYKVWVSSL